MKPYRDGTPLEEILKDGWSRGLKEGQTVAEALVMGYEVTEDYIRSFWHKWEAEMEVATMLVAREVTVECPYCHQPNDGFIGNPRGMVTECEFCGKEFKIHNDADVEIF